MCNGASELHRKAFPLITKSITYLNDYGIGFEASVAINSLNSRVDLDIEYLIDGDSSGDSIGVCMTAEAARGLANMLHNFADKLDGVTNGW